MKEEKEKEIKHKGEEIKVQTSSCSLINLPKILIKKEEQEVNNCPQIIVMEFH